MKRTAPLQEIRKMRFEEPYEGWNAWRLTHENPDTPCGIFTDVRAEARQSEPRTSTLPTVRKGDRVKIIDGRVEHISG
jgi:hypothetical protein